MLHVQYGAPGLLLVALMGIIFSMMLRWSGSLRLPLIAHALNNAVAGLYLMFIVPA
jgi:membrane protease YdiL (CAAX protease family)